MKDLLRGIGAGWLIAIAGFLVICLLIVASYAFSWSIAPFKGATEARNQTVGNGSYRIAAYDHFYDSCMGAETVQQNITNTKKRLKQARKDGDQVQVQIQETNLQAQENDLNGLVNAYNADSHKTHTLAQFKASDLPFTLTTTQEIQCAP